MAPESKIFTPYRGLGLVSNEVPLVLEYMKNVKKNFIITVVGNAFHTYTSNKLRLIRVGNPHTKPITCITADSYQIFTASDNTIFAWKRSTELKHKYAYHKADIILLMPFGPHLISVDKKNLLCVWDTKTEELYLHMEFSENFKISAIVHPATYINKILLGSKDGKMQLWNIRTTKLIYTFSGWNSEVTVLEQAPAPDVVAVGLASGEIYLHNLKYDETVVKFKQDWGPVISITFRTDGAPIMASGSQLGHVALWDLHERRLSSQILGAHKKGVTGMKCLLNEPLMVTSSSDNTLKLWIFDLPDGGARELIKREGHSAPPLMARFHGNLGDTILTAGEDSCVRLFSTVTDILNKSFGQAFYKSVVNKDKFSRERLKMPSIVAFTSETKQEKPWDNIAAIHRDTAVVTTWSIKQQKMGEHKFMHQRFKNKNLSNAIATCLELSVCGNFVIIGYDSGHLDKYNIQSAILRGTYGNPLAHNDTVTGVVADGLNKVVVSGGQDKSMKWWHFKSLKNIAELTLDAGIAILQLHRDSGLLAVALEDFTIQVIDIDTRNVVRKLLGHDNQITDLAFSSDSRWVVSSSLDRTIKTWDLPSSSCIDCFYVPVPASSISISPVGDFLATIHSGLLGVFLWANRTFYDFVSLHPLPEDYKAPTIALPSTGADLEQVPSLDEEEPMHDVEKMEVEEYASPEQISESLITLALLPSSRWLNLLSINTIKRRNKPIEPPKAPKSAPFFLPTVPGLDFKFAEGKEPTENNNKSKVLSATSFECLTCFGESLKAKNYEEAMALLLKMGPSSIDLEIRGLDPDTGGSEEVILNFLKMIKYAISKKKYFEVTQGYLGLFLKVHAEFIVSNSDAQEICQKLLNAHNRSWHEIRDTFNQSLCLLSYFKNSALINY